MKEEYRREMEQLGPRPEELERLYRVMKGEAEMKKTKRSVSKAAVALVCAALMVTAAAAATAPAVWEALQSRLGAFAPYAQTIEGAVCADQGIEVRVLSAISDDLEGRVYLSVRDLEGDRLDQFLTLDGVMTAGEAKDPESVFANGVSVVGGFSTSVFDLVSYDPATKTALLSTAVYYMDTSRPTGKARLSITGLSTQEAKLYTTLPCDGLTEKELDSLSAGEDDRVILDPSHVEGTGYDNSVLPDKHVVLAPGQTPVDIPGTQDVRVSSMGFASDGCFHIRLEFAQGVEPETFINTSVAPAAINSNLYCDLVGGDFDMRFMVVRETLVEGGMDVLFPLLKAEDLEEIRGRQMRVYGTYIRPGTDIEGDWNAEFELDYYPSTVLDWTGELEGWQVEQVTVSPLSVTMKSNASNVIHGLELCAVMKDGSTVAAEAGTSTYSNLDAVAEVNGELTGEPKGWRSFSTWKFQEPVEVEELVSLKLGDTVIPVN